MTFSKRKYVNYNLKLGEKLNHPVFAKGLCFNKLFMVFMFGSFLGTIYEEILMVVRYHTCYTARHGIFFGPFNPLYGFGIVVLILALIKIKKWYNCILAGAVLGGSVEYFASLFQEIFTGTVSWNYSQKFLNINGRTTVIYALFWGIAGFLLVRFIYPYLSALIEKIPYDVGNFIVPFLVLYMSFSIFITFGSMIRLSLFNKNIGPFSPLGKFFDKYFPYKTIKYYFPNLKQPSWQTLEFNL